MRIHRRELLRRFGGAGLGLPLLAASGTVGRAGAPQLILYIAQRSLDRLGEYLPDPLMLRRITYDNGARMLRLRT